MWSLSLIWNRTHTTISYRRRIPIPVTQGRAQKTFLWLLSFNWNGDSTRSNYNMIPIPVKWSHSASLFLNENTTSFMFYLLKSENKPKRFRSETFFLSFIMKLLEYWFPYKFLLFLGSVLLSLCNDTTFVEKTLVSMYSWIIHNDINSIWYIPVLYFVTIMFVCFILFS